MGGRESYYAVGLETEIVMSGTQRFGPLSTGIVALGLYLFCISFASAQIYVDGEKFTFSEIERKCEVYRYSENYGDVECRGSKFRVIERKCEVYFSDESDASGDMECRGSDLRPLESSCSAYMYSEDYGDIDC